ncbi:MAG: UDP-3-O-(3-hydroxymyristoyl)glucosamine N-acyltransferase [Alphaproteobacteria bacterium]
MDSRFFDIKNSMALGQIAMLVDGKLVDESKKDLEITNLGSLENSNENSIIYLALGNTTSALLNKSGEYKEKLKSIKAGACLIKAENAELVPSSMAVVEVDDPKSAFIKLTGIFYKDKALQMKGISSQALIDETVKFADKESVHIGPFAVVEEGVEIGKNCYIASGAKIKAGVKMGDNCIIKENAVISHTIMGNNVKIGEGSCIGGDGFGWHSGAFGHIWVPQLGRVILEDNVDVGINSSIDRGAIDDTIIGSGTKIDNIIQIGHNCKIGKNCILAAMSGVAGSTIIEDWVLVGAAAGVSGHLRIGAGSQIGAGAGVIQNLAPKSVVSGYPAQPVGDFLKQSAMLRRMVKKKKVD